LGFSAVALPHYGRAVTINPGHLRALNNLGNIYFRTGNLDQAAAAYEQILRRDADHVGALITLGQVYLSQQRTEEAVEVLQRVIAQNEGQIAAHQGLAEAYKRLGEIARSEEHRKIAGQLQEDRKGK
jgi:tetratricopeptide (TPR) repeat protein